MLAGKPAFLFLTIKEVDGVAVIAFLETVSMFEGDKVESLAKELFGVIEAKKYKKILLNLYNAGYISSTMLAHLVRLHRKMQDVNTPPRLKSCGFWANPPVGKLSAQGLIPAPLEDDDRGVVVPIEGHAAIAFDPTIPERKMLEPGTATRARLGRVGRINLDDLATSTFSLVREMGDKVGPTRIQDAHGEAAGHHGGNPKVFEHDPIESRDQFVDELVEEVFPCIGHMDHQALQSQDQPATVAAAEHAPCDLPLKDTQLSKNPAIPAGVFFLLPIAERGQSHEPEIDADRFPSLRQRFGLLDRAGESDEPLPRSAEDTGRLDRSFKPAIPANGDPADAKKIEATAIDLEAIAVFLEAESRKAVPDLEPGIAGILTGLDPAKERLERFVQVGHDVLKDVAMDVQRVGAGRFLHLDFA